MVKKREFPMTRRAASSLLILISLFSAGCASKREASPETILIYPARCGRPTSPELPKLSGLKFLESREAYSRLKLRDSVMRSYIAGLEDALDCYEAQLPPNTGGK